MGFTDSHFTEIGHVEKWILPTTKRAADKWISPRVSKQFSTPQQDSAFELNRVPPTFIQRKPLGGQIMIRVREE